jgi:hypothetical protein
MCGPSFVLRIIAIILNAHLLIYFIWCRHEIIDDLVLEAYFLCCGLPAINLVTLALTFTKEKEKNENFSEKRRLSRPQQAIHASRDTRCDFFTINIYSPRYGYKVRRKR